MSAPPGNEYVCQWVGEDDEGHLLGGEWCGKPALWTSCNPFDHTPTCTEHKCRCAQPLRCPTCSWPLAATKEEGCVPGNCSYRGPRGALAPLEYGYDDNGGTTVTGAQVQAWFAKYGTPPPDSAWRAGDRPIFEDAAIAEAHPLRSGRHDLYANAMRLVGAKRSKAPLVELVTWLLLCGETKCPATNSAAPSAVEAARARVSASHESVVAEVMRIRHAAGPSKLTRLPTKRLDAALDAVLAAETELGAVEAAAGKPTP